MTEVKSLRSQILEHLAPQVRGKPKQKRSQMAVAGRRESARPKTNGTSLTESAPALRKGATMLYKGKPVQVQSLNESTGMAMVKQPRRKEPIFVRAVDLQATELTEAFLGMAPIGFTYVEPRRSEMVRLENLSPEDIGLDLSGLLEDDQEEDADNGSNVRHDGHSGKTEVDALPTPSDTIAPAYSDEQSPKQEGSPLSTEPGAEPSKLWEPPDWDGYDYPADAPEIPTPEFGGAEMGNSRAPTMGGGHDGGDGQENRHHDADNPEPDDETNESYRGRNGFSFVSEDGHDDYMGAYGNGGNIIPQPQGMGSAIAHDEVYGNLNTARSGNGPTGIPQGGGPGARSAANTPYAGTGPSGGALGPRPAANTAYAGPGGENPVARMPDGKPTFDMDQAGHFRAEPTYGSNLDVGGAVPNAVSNAATAKPSGPALPQVPQHGPNMENAVLASYKKLLAEMDDLLGGEDREPQHGDTITMTLPAMASVFCTIAHKVQDEMMMKAVIEALAEVGHGKTIDLPDLEAVASHVNGEEAQEFENREQGRPDHEGIDHGHDHEGHDHEGHGEFGDDHESHGGDDHGGDDYESPSGDGEPTNHGKTKLMGGMGESVGASDFYGLDDIVRECALSEEDELRLMKRRAGFKYW